MDLRGMRWPVLITSVLATFAVLFGAFALYRHQAVDGSVVRQYEQVAGVEDVVLETGGGLTDVIVTLGPGADLAAVYRELVEAGDRVLGQGRYRLTLRDQRDEAVSEAFYRMHFSLQEANATGRFTEMARAVDDIAEMAALTRYRVEVGDNHIFVTLEKDGQYLYEVLPRRQEG